MLTKALKITMLTLLAFIIMPILCATMCAFLVEYWTNYFVHMSMIRLVHTNFLAKVFWIVFVLFHIKTAYHWYFLTNIKIRK